MAFSHLDPGGEEYQRLCGSFPAASRFDVGDYDESDAEPTPAIVLVPCRLCGCVLVEKTAKSLCGYCKGVDTAKSLANEALIARLSES